MEQDREALEQALSAEDETERLLEVAAVVEGVLGTEVPSSPRRISSSTGCTSSSLRGTAIRWVRR